MINPLFDLSGKVAVVSGAASGLGRASAIALAAHGATLVLLDRDASGMDATRSLIVSAGGTAHSRIHDVSSVHAAAELFEWLDQNLGQIDFLYEILEQPKYVRLIIKAN